MTPHLRPRDMLLLLLLVLLVLLRSINHYKSSTITIIK